VIRAFRKAPSGIASVVAMASIAIVAIAAPALFGHQAVQLDLGSANQNPTSAHLLGTDRLGRDVLYRTLVATRLSISLAVIATAFAAVVGFLIGAVAAVLPPRPRSAALRALDSLIAFPPILVAVFVGAIVGPGAAGATIGVGLAISFQFARVVSTLALSVGGREYVAAARVVGVSTPRIIVRYLLPNIAETIVVVLSVAMSSAIVFISSLSFLGLGVQAPDYDWGRMLTEGVQAFYATPVYAIAPATAIAIAALAFGLAGEALARATNPLLWTADTTTRGRRTPATAPARSAHAPSANGHTAAPDAVLEVRGLVVTFGDARAPVDVVKDVSFSIRKGEMVAIVGESGSGKTMTAMGIAQLVPYPGTVTGSVSIDGRDLRRLSDDELRQFLGTDLAVVFQDPMASLNPALKIGTQLTEGVEVHRHLKHRDAIALAVKRLTQVNIAGARGQLERHSHELSGGMRQRTMIAMGLMTEPHLLIADEPTTALDVTIQAQIMDLLNDINASHGTAVVLISHNLALVSQNCQRVMVMYAGRIVEELTADELLRGPHHPYTRALLNSVPDIHRNRTDEVASIPGEAPDMASPPSGCPFHPRCPLAVDRCREERPPLERHASGGRVACWRADEVHAATPAAAAGQVTRAGG
jgi:peptide/nickel transport system permease protein